jgi:copper(I)-binding protein
LTFIFAAGCTQADKLTVEDAWARPGNQDANSAIYFIIANNTGQTDTLISGESDIAQVVELHESMMKPADAGQGEMAKSVEGQDHEHMETHHQSGDLENHNNEECEYHEDHSQEDEHHDEHHVNDNMQDHHYEDCEYTDAQHEDGDHHDDHHPDVEMSSNTVETSMGMSLEGGVMTMVQQENVPISAQSELEFKPGGLHIMLIGLNQDLNPGDRFTVKLNFENAGEISLDVTVREP